MTRHLASEYSRPTSLLFVKYDGISSIDAGTLITRFFKSELDLHVTTTLLRSMYSTATQELVDEGVLSERHAEAVDKINGHSAATRKRHYIIGNLVKDVRYGRDVAAAIRAKNPRLHESVGSPFSPDNEEDARDDESEGDGEGGEDEWTSRLDTPAYQRSYFPSTASSSSSSSASSPSRDHRMYHEHAFNSPSLATRHLEGAASSLMAGDRHHHQYPVPARYDAPRTYVPPAPTRVASTGGEDHPCYGQSDGNIPWTDQELCALHKISHAHLSVNPASESRIVSLCRLDIRANGAYSRQFHPSHVQNSARLRYGYEKYLSAKPRIVAQLEAEGGGKHPFADRQRGSIPWTDMELAIVHKLVDIQRRRNPSISVANLMHVCLYEIKGNPTFMQLFHMQHIRSTLTLEGGYDLYCAESERVSQLLVPGFV